MTDITIQKTQEDAASASLQITVPVDRVKAAEAKAVRYYQSRARLPGFRPGKAPEDVIRRRFEEAIRQNVLEEVIRDSWDTVRSSGDLKPIAEPHIHNLKFQDSGEIAFEFHVEVRPDIELARLGGFTLQRKVKPVSDEDVTERIRALQEQKALWQPVEGARPAPGQMVRVEVATLEDGEAKPAQAYDLVLGEGQTIPDLEEKIMTLLPGETLDTEVRFPDDHPDESRRGQSRQVRVTLLEVKTQELPALTDEFARELGDFQDLAALRAALREDLEKDAGREADAGVRQQLIEQIAAANTVTAPASLVQRVIKGYAQMYQIPDDQLERFAGEFRPVAENQVRRELILDRIVEANDLRASESELDARIAGLAEARGVPAGQMYTSLQKANRLGELQRALTEEKAFTFLLEQSTVEEVSE
ncbi:MAG: trigger factor [Gemmatimonadales bacterium]